MTAVMPNREAWARVSKATRAVERDHRERIPAQTTRRRENAQRMHAAIITDRFGGPNATYDAEGIANRTVTVEDEEPINRAIDGVDYLPAEIGSLCFIVEDAEGNRQLWVPEKVETQDCADEEEVFSMGEINADRQAQSWMGF